MMTGRATLADLLPARIATLAKGATTTMFMGKVIVVALVGLALAAWHWCSPARSASEGTPPPPVALVEAPPIRTQAAPAQPPKEAGPAPPGTVPLGRAARAGEAPALRRHR